MSGPGSARSRLRQLFFGKPRPPEPEIVGEASEAEEFAVELEAAVEAADALTGPRDLYYASGDGLRLHVAEYGHRVSPWLPVVCIPGLSRSARDFHDLALRLSTHPERPRRVLAFDLRGRGKSEWDADIGHYTPLVEMQDVLDGMAALSVDRAVIVGTSRGGLIAMLMGVARPSVIAGVVLNDVGPALEARGLARLKTYIGRTPAPDDWEDAAHILRRLHGHQFTAFVDDDWRKFARMTWRDDDDALPVGDYDPALARTFDGIEFDQPLPSLWREFGALAAKPVLAIRGANSDILSPATLDRMAAEHPRFESVVLEGQGHAPLLIHEPILRRVADFVAAQEGESARR
jgi:pimeloyl-ACP methyl ester carboxylesterase